MYAVLKLGRKHNLSVKHFESFLYFFMSIPIYFMSAKNGDLCNYDMSEKLQRQICKTGFEHKAV